MNDNTYEYMLYITLDVASRDIDDIYDRYYCYYSYDVVDIDWNLMGHIITTIGEAFKNE